MKLPELALIALILLSLFVGKLMAMLEMNGALTGLSVSLFAWIILSLYILIATKFSAFSLIIALITAIPIGLLINLKTWYPASLFLLVGNIGYIALAIFLIILEINKRTLPLYHYLISAIILLHSVAAIAGIECRIDDLSHYSRLLSNYLLFAVIGTMLIKKAKLADEEKRTLILVGVKCVFFIFTNTIDFN